LVNYVKTARINLLLRQDKVLQRWRKDASETKLVS
jgi:hypothetical protein